MNIIILVLSAVMDIIRIFFKGRGNGADKTIDTLANNLYDTDPNDTLRVSKPEMWGK